MEKLSDTISRVDRATGASRGSNARDRDVDVVILAGSVGHEASWARGVPRTLLPLAPGQSVLTTLIGTLSSAFDGTTTICANGSTHHVEEHINAHVTNREKIRYYRDTMPRGTGGCIKGAVAAEQKRTMLVAGGAVWLEDDPQWMVAQHRNANNVLTVFCTEQHEGNTIEGHRVLAPTGLYCVEPSVLPHIQDVGFQDLKEQVIPALKRAGLRVGAVVLRKPAIEITDCRDYFCAVSRALATGAGTLVDYRELAPGIWCGHDVTIAADARIIGPAVIGHGVRLESRSMVIGPAIIGNRCIVGEGTWAIRSIVPDGTRLSAGKRFADTIIVPTAVKPARHGRRVPPSLANVAPDTQEATSSSDAASGWTARVGSYWLPLGALCAAFAWAFASSLGRLWNLWLSDGDYSAGLLVPLAAFYLMTTRRSARREDRQFQCWSVGLAVFGLGVALHLLGGGYHYDSLQHIGVVLSAVGILMSVIGRREARRLWYPLLFMFLMLPLPHRLHAAVIAPLQDFGAGASRMALGWLRIPVVQHGHILEVSRHGLSVAEGCSGLRMAIAALIVTAFLVYLVRRPRWQKIIVLVSSVPIALVCNVLRIVAIACFYHFGLDALARGAFHQGTGIAMMPMTLLVVLIEFGLLQRLCGPPVPLTIHRKRLARVRTVSRG